MFRAKLPAGSGLSAALWLRTPESRPFDGEIDVIENVGSQPHGIQSTVHHWLAGKHLGQHSAVVGLQYRNNAEDVTNTIGSPPDFSASYHDFAVDWRPDHITWFLDETPYYTVTSDVPNEPMRLVFNLAVGGGFAGSPTSQTHFPVWLDVASAHVYR